MDTLVTVCAIILAIALKVGFFILYAWKSQKNVPKKIAAEPLEVVQAGEAQEPAAKGIKQKRILVTGGCGYLGSAIVRQLHERMAGKASLVVLDAAVHDRFGPLVPGVKYIRGDITTYTHVHAALADCACVIHTAGLVGDCTTPEAAFKSVNLQGTRNVVEACLDRDVTNLVYTSSGSVLFSNSACKPGGAGGSLVPLLERAAPLQESDLNGAYATSKAAAEQLVLAANSHVLRTVALRPGGVYGMQDMGMVTSVVVGKPFIAPGLVHVPFVWVEDAARAHCMAAEQLLFPQPGPDGAAPQRIHGRAYHLSHDPVRDPFLYREFGGGALTTDADLAAAGIVDRKHASVIKAEEAAGVTTTRDCAAMRAAGVNAFGMKVNGGVAFSIIKTLAAVNNWVGKRTGLILFDARFTPENMRYAANHWPMDIRDAVAVLGWEPTPFRVVVARLGEESTEWHAVAARRWRGVGVDAGAGGAAGKAKKA